jgi:hypothetical protein
MPLCFFGSVILDFGHSPSNHIAGKWQPDKRGYLDLSLPGL